MDKSKIQQHNATSAYRLNVALSLKSKYSHDMYEMLCQFRDTGSLHISIKELKKRLGLIDLKTGKEKYADLNAFRAKVLDVAQKELGEKSDVIFRYEAKKTGRKYTDLIFTIRYVPPIKYVPNSEAVPKAPAAPQLPLAAPPAELEGSTPEQPVNESVKAFYKPAADTLRSSFLWKKLRGFWKKLLLLVGGFVVLVVAMLVFDDTPEEEGMKIGMFGKLTLSEKVRPKKRQLTREEMLSQHNKHPGNRLLRKSRGPNPLLPLYKAEKKPAPSKKVEKKKVKPKRAPKPVEKVEEEWDPFPNSWSAPKPPEKEFFEAVFREAQQVQDGKALRIFLKEDIPSLKLDAGTLLKGIPYLAGGRIRIKITAAVANNKVRRVSLICFDKEDCVEGVYHDELAAQLEEDAKSGVLDEILDLDFKGARIGRRISELTRRYGTLLIERGREIFVALPGIIQE